MNRKNQKNLVLLLKVHKVFNVIKLTFVHTK
jgi:hypothetical protein